MYINPDGTLSGSVSMMAAGWDKVGAAGLRLLSRGPRCCGPAAWPARRPHPSPVPPSLQAATQAGCERLLEGLLPPGFDRALVGPITASMMAGPLSK